MKLLEKKDFAGQLKTRGVRPHWELKWLMNVIDNTAKIKGVFPKKGMNKVEANQCFTFCHDGLNVNVPHVIPSGKPLVFAELTLLS